ncbi:DUF368 domain-containing protein [Paenibacillus agaridevorans]|uniref:DUF368 domain-containing protein n=1 Tax=Paenibacillus agaridevorans TaxID=171404 RepID=UPI001BE425E4|nr:DUF368 domain-containing protein [Paenibacillus agaridevorans]
MLNWKSIVKGMAMGSVETVPGVSSSTIAMLMGIYENLIESIGNLTSRRWKEGVAYLIPIGIGMIGGFLVSVLLISYLLEHFMQPTHFLFMGLVIGMLPSLWRNSRKESGGTFRWSHMALLLLAFAGIAATRFLDQAGVATMVDLSIGDYLFLFASGWLASTALILPGVSGALVLTILGVYYTAITAISEMDLPILLAISGGILTGVLITSKLIRFLLSRHTLIMYSLMIGMVAGSTVVLYPGFADGAMGVAVCIAAAVAGCLIALFAGRVGRR